MRELRRLRLLNIGAGKNGSIPDRIRPEDFKEIVTLDINPECEPDIVADISGDLDGIDGEFDVVVAFHVIEHIDFNKVLKALENMKSLVADRGELWLAVPAMEWAAIQLSQEAMHPVLQGFIYGSQENEYEYHRSCFRLQDLRGLVQAIGLIPREAYQAPLILEKEGKIYQAVQNIVIALRDKEFENALGDPSGAISD